MLLISNIRKSLDADDGDAIEEALSRLGNLRGECERAVIVRKGVDARRKNVTHVYSVGLYMKSGEKEAAKRTEGASVREEFVLNIPKASPGAGARRPVICGFGPAGMFAALVLSRAGLRPIVLERGADADARAQAVETYIRTGKLDTNTNIQFGEGGAGTFSDGKLTTRIGSPVCSFVLKTFASHGAPEEILYLAKPHIGTDILINVVKSIRREIVSLGGEIRFLCRAERIITKNGRVSAVVTADGETVETDTLILASGHSARDMYEHIYESGISMTAKPFSVGFRIEHLREDIDAAMYGRFAGHKNLKSAEYQLSYREGERGVYTFCMCPGGEVVAASSEEGGFAVNGMSRHARDGINSNSAVVASVSAQDFGGGVLSGIEFQRKLERSAYALAGGNAPVSTLGAYMKTGTGEFTRVMPSIRFKTREADISPLFPKHIDVFLKRGLLAFDRKLSGFCAPYAVITGVETRTSAPVRILRDETRQSPDARGLYPCGEGAGYAGGIMSAAVDGVNTAMEILKNMEG